MSVLSWVDFSVKNGDENIGHFSLKLEEKDFLFLAGETDHKILIRALAGFLPELSNCSDSARVKDSPLKDGEQLRTVLLPKNASLSLPKHRTIGDFALDIASNRTPKSLAEYAEENGIDVDFLEYKPANIDLPDLQKISLWLTSLYKTTAVFVEEPEGGFCDSVRPFNFLQNMLKKSLTSCIVYFTPRKEGMLKKAESLQFCNAKIAVFCGDKLVETGDAVQVLRNPHHAYTKEYLKFGSAENIKKAGALWTYCASGCGDKTNCPKRVSGSPAMWDCGGKGEHKVICRIPR